MRQKEPPTFCKWSGIEISDHYPYITYKEFMFIPIPCALSSPGKKVGLRMLSGVISLI